jgi:hypothetical protein
MSRRLVSHESLAGALQQVERETLATPSAFEQSQISDAELRAQLTEALSVLQAEGESPGIMVTAQNQLASLLQTHLVEHPEELKLTEVPVPNSAFEVKYDNGDVLGWARSVLDWWRKIKPEPWIEPAGEPEPIGDGKRASIALMGDWGTGLYGAPVIAKTLAAAPGSFDLLLHLGDVYYSGTPKEVEHNFKRLWPKAAGRLNRALNANHEMYSGGEGLYKVTMPWFGQRATTWSAQTDRWLLVGLDSAYEDHDLAHEQATWVQGLLDRADGRHLLLFSHHQPYSLLDKQGPKLVAKLGRMLDRKQVFGWYWGHEHRCVIYDAHPVWGLRGRCVGHGGFPAYRDKLASYPQEGDGRWRRLPPRNLVPGGLVLDMPNPYVENDPDRYGANGYVTLEIDDASLRERVHAPDGAVLLDHELA